MLCTNTMQQQELLHALSKNVMRREGAHLSNAAESGTEYFLFVTSLTAAEFMNGVYFNVSLLESTRLAVPDGSQAPANGPAAEAPAPMQVDNDDEGEDCGITSSIVQKLATTAKGLSKGRKKRVKALAQNAPKKGVIKTFKVLSSNPLHLSGTKAGINCLDLHPTKSDLVLL